MRLSFVRWHWERLARRDPFWAVLTDPAKRERQWDPDEFFRSGEEEIAARLNRAKEMGIAVPRDRALDFGCGVGRLTQALARHFDRCDGVDISAPMLRLARRYNRHGDRCAYHRNVTADLRLFPDGAFSFVYTTLVLQHMAPELAVRYIRELVRVLAPGGLLVFQVPSHRASQPPALDAPRTPVSGPLPAAACRGRLRLTSDALAFDAGELATVAVLVENQSPHVWPSLPDARGGRQINLANHWLGASGEMVRRDDGRCPLPHDLAPGTSAVLMLGIEVPRTPGAYTLELDLVQENACWFAERGFETLRVPCLVRGSGAAYAPAAVDEVPGSEPPPGRADSDAEQAPPFRERHPAAFQVLKATGLRRLYWAWRRSLDEVRTRRDQVIRGVVHPVIRTTVHPLINWWRSQPFSPKMEMHCVARPEVLALLEREGATAVAVDEELVPGGFQSCRYWVCKGPRPPVPGNDS